MTTRCLAIHALSATALALLSVAAGAQPISRANTAPAAPLATQPDPVLTFARANDAAGHPRFAVYWNRVLTDELVGRTERYLTGSYRHTTADDGVSGHYDAALGVRAAREKANEARLGDTVDWRLESAFYEPLQEAGARLVDRNLTMRTIRQGQRDDAEPNRQLVETEALQGKADYLIEVQITPDLNAPAQVRFRVTAKKIDTGEVVALFSTLAAGQTTPYVQYVATATGYERQTVEPEVSLEDVGHQLAQETMARLARSIGQR